MQNGPNTIAPGSVTISAQKTGTVVAVAWLEPNSTAVFSFRGSTSTQDWLQDFQLWYSTSPVQTQKNCARAPQEGRQLAGMSKWTCFID